MLLGPTKTVMGLNSMFLASAMGPKFSTSRIRLGPWRALDCFSVVWGGHGGVGSCKRV